MYPNRPNNTRQKALAGTMVVTAIVLITGGVHAYEQRKVGQSDTTAQMSPANTSTATSGDSTTTQTVTSNNSKQATTPNGYKDGTYTTSSNYFVPDGNESIKVTLTVKSGIVTNSQIVNSEGDPTSASYQQDFAASYKSYVVGKKLNSIQLSYVAGASDTTQGFNDALTKIERQAQA